jgi:hypothetical protein
MTARVGWALALALVAAPAWGQAQQQQPDRPKESEIFGAQPAEQKPPAEEKKPAGEQPPPADRPKESDIFGGQPAEQKPAEAPEQVPAGQPPASDQANPQTTPTADPEIPRASTPESTRDDAILGVSEAGRLAADAAPEDPLRIGGMFYLRAQTTAREDESPDDWALGAPSLVDAYLDARPNERVRGLIVGRLFFDPTLPAQAGMPTAMQIAPAESGATMGTSELSSLFAGRTRGPTAALDQMWLRFDLKHRVFVTAGKQHVRWGTARFWTPTDYLHIRKRNPLDVFDARLGTTMVKLHAPWEAMGWNFYAYGLLEDADPTPQLGNVAGAARAEIVLGTTEVGLGALVRRGQKPKFGFDASTGIWDIDLYGELALRYGSEIDRVTKATDPMAPDITQGLPGLVEVLYPTERRSGVKAQVVGGASYSRKYNDNDVFHIGLEYFYNPLGYDDSDVYPGLVLPRTVPLQEPATFFYLGRQYGALFLSVPAPYSWDQTTFTLSTLGNFSDGSYITRLDYALVLLTHLRFEAYAAVRYGDAEGEFRFGIRNLQIAGMTFSSPPAVLDLGLGLRVSL